MADLAVWLTSTTEQWSVIAVQGPKARTLLAPMIDGLDLSVELFPHMSVADAQICGVPMRLMRVSYTGELGYEINVPSDHGRLVWEAIWERGKSFGAVAYGTETMHVLRAEKGFIMVGQETDGTVTLGDVGLSWAIGKSKADFVGKRSLSLPAMDAADRKQLVGLLTRDPRIVLEEGAQIVDDKAECSSIGHVTSAYHSEAMGRSIALALVRSGRERIGHTLAVAMPNGVIPVEITEPVFFDPDGQRANG